MMVSLSAWIRRSNALTGAEWITSRFGEGRGAEFSRAIVVLFAVVSVVGFIAYDFQGMGKFTQQFLPWDWSPETYGVLIMAVTALYVLLGGMISVVFTDVAQFAIMAVCSLIIAVIAIDQVSPEQLRAVVPAGWGDAFFGWRLDLDWSPLIPALRGNLDRDGYSIFGLFFMAMLFKGVLVSLAGPAPNYDMQRILAAKNPREAASRHYVAVGWMAQALILAVGIAFGWQAASINQVTQWIVNGLLGGYTAPNLLKWHWYRFNGYGYFWGMTAGITAALAMPVVAPEVHPLQGFPVIFGLSLAASIAGSLLTAPEPDEVLARFYRQGPPRGLWGRGP